MTVYEKAYKRQREELKEIPADRIDELCEMVWSIRETLGPLNSLGLDHRDGRHGKLLDEAYVSLTLTVERLDPILRAYNKPMFRPKKQREVQLSVFAS